MPIFQKLLYGGKMNHEFINRFEELIHFFENGNRAAFARKTNKKPSFITRLCQGQANPTAEMLFEIHKIYGVNTDWLLTGEGQMLNKKDERKFMEKENTKLEKNKKVTALETLSEYDFCLVPYFEEVRVAAGYGSFNMDEKIEKLPLPKSWIRGREHSLPHLFFVIAYGDSMYPTFGDGDFLLVDSSIKDFQGDAIYIIRVDEVVFVKRLQWVSSRKLLIVSDNKEQYPQQHLALDDDISFQILGKVLHAWKTV